ncbi:MAG: zinc dependent phospholipase C family protein, partial [Spirochaetaceae bacterium]|nr:zinc dependent phospholipase C family protein [Spirochaetaceae bacterium]
MDMRYTVPSQILHLLFGEDVLAALYERLKGRFGNVAEEALLKIKRDYRPGFALGCQGPDIFYHNQSSRPVGLEYGTLLHRRGCGVFTASLLKMALPGTPPTEREMRRRRREAALGAKRLSPSQKITALGAYALGFMTHALLDRKTHPYIVYKAARRHAFFERILDVTMLRLLRGLAVSSWDQETLLAEACAKPPEGLGALLEKALVSAFPERAGKDEKLPLRIANTFRDAAAFYSATDPRKTTMRG